MKTIATLIFVLLIGFTAQAQDATEESKVAAVEMTIVTETAFEKGDFKSAVEVARLYKRSNSRVKKELSFATRANRSKTA